MNSFLQHIATYYWTTRGAEIGKLRFVFPNRRAGLFFLKHLSELAQKPIFAPDILTIDQLFLELTDLKPADQLDMLFRLWEVYQADFLSLRADREESFDQFIYWGQTMIADFSEIDQSLADAELLLSNIGELKDIEFRFQHLSAEQIRSLQQFIDDYRLLDNEVAENNPKKEFVHIWSCLKNIYNHFKANLLQDRIAYTGLLQREVIEHLGDNIAQLKPDSEYIFIGFNALTETERRLMKAFQHAGLASFHWDYSSAFLQDKENRASIFMHDNLRDFGNTDIGYQPNNQPKIELYKISSYIGEAQVASQLIKQTIESQSTIDLTKIAVVMPDEQMLLPMVQYLPKEVKNLNITMGYPLSLTPMCSLVQLLSELQLMSKSYNESTVFYHRQVLSLLAHPYLFTDNYHSIRQHIEQRNLTYISPRLFSSDKLLRLVFKPVDSSAEVIDYLRDIIEYLLDRNQKDRLLTDESTDAATYLYQTITILNRVSGLLEKHGMNTAEAQISVRTIFSLVVELMRQVRIPYQGEPLLGLQLMGVLESRGLDFDTVIITNFNDEQFPPKGSRNSFIPYDLRLAFSLPTPDRQDAIYAYNFYRLLSHCNRLILIQNTIADEMQSGEVSRYLYQLSYQYHFEIEEHNIVLPNIKQPELTNDIYKSEEVIQHIKAKLKKGISPSALNNYVSCPKKFYYTDILGIREPKEVAEEMGEDSFGTIVHGVLEVLYNEEVSSHGSEITTDSLERMLRQLYSTNIVEKIYRRDFLKQNDSKQPLEGKDQLPIMVAKRYVSKVLNFDKRLCPFRYIASEKKCEHDITLSDGTFVKLKGIIDRVDEVNGQIRIIDYKTGSSKHSFPGWDELYSANSKSDHWRQTLTYCYMYSHQTDQNKDQLVPYIYYVKLSDTNFCTEIAVSNKQKKNQDELHGFGNMLPYFEPALIKVLEEINDATVPFIAKIDSNNTCKYCPFISICEVKVIEND